MCWAEKTEAALVRLYRLPKRPGGSAKPRKRKLNKRNAKSKTPAFHFQGDCGKRWKAPPNNTVSTQGEAGGRPRGSSAPAQRSCRSASPHLPPHRAACAAEEPRVVFSVAQNSFPRGRENDCPAREAKTGLLSPESHCHKHPITPEETNGGDEGSFNTPLFLGAQQHHPRRHSAASEQAPSAPDKLPPAQVAVGAAQLTSCSAQRAVDDLPVQPGALFGAVSSRLTNCPESLRCQDREQRPRKLRAVQGRGSPLLSGRQVVLSGRGAGPRQGCCAGQLCGSVAPPLRLHAQTAAVGQTEPSSLQRGGKARVDSGTTEQLLPSSLPLPNPLALSKDF